MMIIGDKKYDALLENIREHGSVAVAFSGGVDSTFLLHATSIALPGKAVAITVKSPYVPEWEMQEAREIAETLDVKHYIIETDIPENIKNNPDNRCYLCKKTIFKLIRNEATKLGYKEIIEGTNADDLNDHRPGIKALRELSIKSPLLETGFSKMNIREYSERLELHTFDKPAYACLLTRLPYNVEVLPEHLERIEKAEFYLFQQGFQAARVRMHDDLARIEVDKAIRKELIKPGVSDKIIKYFKQLGFRFITIDLEGYRMGSFN
ncbi:MAG: ATP-dependent sacrificial sulfur transferase LarE [Bacteroidales bacterium]